MSDSIPLTFTDGLDPAQFHCIRYIGPPIKSDSFDKSALYYKFEGEGGCFIAALACSWRTSKGEPDAYLLAPFWMRHISALRGSSSPELKFEKITNSDIEEYSGELELSWLAGLGPLDSSTFPYEEVLPELFGSDRPLSNNSVLPFVFRGQRYLLQVNTGGGSIEDGKVFWFNLDSGSIKIHQDGSAASSGALFYDLLDKLVIDGSWENEMRVLKFQLESPTNDRELFLICGVPVPLQEAFVHKLNLKSIVKSVEMGRFISDEHLQVDSEDDCAEGDVVRYLLDVDRISSALINDVLKATRGGRLIMLSSQDSLGSSHQLIQLEKSARRFNFQIHSLAMPKVLEKERFLCFNYFLRDENLKSAFEANKFALNSFSLIDLMRVGLVYKSIRTKESFESAIKIVKDSINENGASNRGYEILSAFKSVYPFYGFSELKRELEVLLKGPLLHPEAYERFGLPKSSGFLIHGPSGCGKTSLCLHLLTSPPLSDHFTLFHVPSASQLLSKYFGETEANIRRLFAMARERKPSIIFIDQIEALGRRRGLEGTAAAGGSSDANDRYLSTLLNEMDGISGNEGVSVIACANDLNFLDEALIRPGRLDRHFHLGIPENADELFEGFCKEFNVEAKNININKNNLIGLTGSQIKSLINQSIKINIL